MLTSNDLESRKNTTDGASKTVFSLDDSWEQTQTLRVVIVIAPLRISRLLFAKYLSNEKQSDPIEGKTSNSPKLDRLYHY